MSVVKIFVEGIADGKFLSDYIKYLLPESVKNYDIVIAEGWKINQGIRQIMQWNTDEGGVNLIVFDADSNFESRKKEIEKWRSGFNLSFELFLFPNNSDKGTLENLLEAIIPENNRPVLDCWESYERCLKSKTIKGREEPLTTPPKKAKIYGYLEALLGESKKEKEKIQEKAREYGNTDHWDLESAYLSPLKKFLVQHLRIS